MKKKKRYYITAEKVDFNLVNLLIENGIDFLQYRKKESSAIIKMKEALMLKEYCARKGTLFIINDDVLLAKEIDADGVHLGEDDMSIAEAREILGESSILGKTAKTLESALRAIEEGANYLGVGALYVSETKPDAVRISFKVFKEICTMSPVPVFAIGGIRKESLEDEWYNHCSGYCFSKNAVSFLE